MPGDRSKLAAAKSVLSQAEKDFPSLVTPQLKAAPTTPAAPKPAPLSGRALIRQQNLQAVAPIAKSVGMKGVGTLGVLHKGGVVPKTGNYTLKEGEMVIAAPEDKKSAGRNSEYRKVYLARRQSRQGGGNTPAKEEKHH